MFPEHTGSRGTKDAWSHQRPAEAGRSPQGPPTAGSQTRAVRGKVSAVLSTPSVGQFIMLAPGPSTTRNYTSQEKAL